MSPARRLIVRLSTSLALIGLASHAALASGVDPAYRFRTLETRHFSIHFHQGEDELAMRLSAIAEDVWLKLERPLGTAPPAHTHVILVDQTELANGYATPVPYNTILVTAAWPRPSEFLGKTDDWLRLVFTHEFTHIVHLDRSVGWARFVRGVFGRMPIAFPNLYLPRWQVEGLATYYESALTDMGRLHAGDFRAVVGEAARAGRLEPLGRVNGGLTDWPGELGVYAYGLGFHEYLATRFGEERLAALAKATAGRVPFTASRVFRDVYGASLGDLWRDYEASETERSAVRAKNAERASSGPEPRRLTHHGFVVSGPRFDRAACDACPPRVIYSVRTPHEFPGLYEITVNGSAPRRLASRYLGASSTSDGTSIYFDQQELQRNVGLYSDLYRLDRATGRVVRLTSEARLLDPDLSPDGTTLVCVQDHPGRRDLVLVSVASGFSRTVLVSEPETQFNSPRWSPDGRSIVAVRHPLGRESEIVVVDAATRTIRVVAAEPKVRFATPAWRPDGGAVIAAADFDDGPFNLYEIALDQRANGLRQLTAVSGGATWPDVSADGRSIVFVGYTADGFDLFDVPYPSPEAGGAGWAGWAGRPGPMKLQPVLPILPVQPFQPSSASAYNPLASLRPTSWSPILEGDRHQLRIGIAAGGADVLGYHGYAVSASWLTKSDSEPPEGNAASADWHAIYQYARWRPVLWLSASSTTSFFAGAPGDDGRPITATLREREFEGGIALPMRRVKVSQFALTSFVAGTQEQTRADRLTTTNRTAWRAGWMAITAQRYGYSISPEDGVSVGATSELVRSVFGASADATAATVDGRVYVSPFARHQVLALRAAGGWSSGDRDVRRTFHLGGPQPNSETLDFDRNAISLLRGFSSDTFAGSRVALVNAEYRWPIARPQYGPGTWPIFLHTLHAAAFVDAGHVWTRAFSVHDLKTSIGGELSFAFVAGYSFPLTATVGAAWGRDGSRAVAGGSVGYVRIGRSF